MQNLTKGVVMNKEDVVFRYVFRYVFRCCMRMLLVTVTYNYFHATNGFTVPLDIRLAFLVLFVLAFN